MSDQDKTGFFANFVNNIEDYINNLVTLEIKTVVGDFKLEGDDNKVVPKGKSDFKIMNSEIHLLKGDITSYVSNDLIQDRYAWVRDYHAQKEAHGHKIIGDNIKAVYSLFELYNQTKSVEVPENSNFSTAAVGTTSAQPVLNSPESFDPTVVAGETSTAETFENTAFDPSATAAKVDTEAPAIDFDSPADGSDKKEEPSS
ncbi:hypothetical protein EI427_03320 [Flammeovirga pectinis]|uniref:Uncharacterized protein n=1 Tax=Flammeovirga pectinis TaxID=2494373 RepID=A0A3S9NZC7_9BACT|nr:hypothetical protein [Flammeovirga pectinis]AZQ61285.1 hypothetical protein EI427_03320 [Flammeovirga pectinis]